MKFKILTLKLPRLCQDATSFYDLKIDIFSVYKKTKYTLNEKPKTEKMC